MLDIAAARAPFGGFTSERALQDETPTIAGANRTGVSH